MSLGRVHIVDIKVDGVGREQRSLVLLQVAWRCWCWGIRAVDDPVCGEYEYEFAREMLCEVPDRCHTAKGSGTGDRRAYWSFTSRGGESMRCASWVTASSCGLPYADAPARPVHGR